MAFQQQGGQVAKGVVKWFNTTKGFGFVALEDNGGEVFLHMSALEQAGLPAPAEGTPITCEIGAGKKGPQVTRVIEVGSGGAPMRSAPSPRRDFGPAPAGVPVEGAVKWFSPERGYGFVTADDGEADVFFNADCLRRAGLPSLAENQRVVVTVITTPKGREATGVRLI